MSPKAIFFDRDDTLIKDKNYMYQIKDLEFVHDAIKTLKYLQEANYLLFIVTNQSGIGRGYFTEKDMHNFHQALLTELEKHQINIQEIAFCPHRPEDKCHCRKPSPLLINKLCEKYNIDKSLSYMVGDKKSDIEAGKNAGLKTIQIIDHDLAKLMKQL